MKDINVMINEITENLMDVTGYEKALDIRSVLYMHLSGYQLSEACTDVSAGGVAFPEAVRDWGIELQLNGCTEETLRTYAYNMSQFLLAVNKDLKDITEMDIKRYLAEGKMIRKWKDSTYNLRLRTVRSFFRYCADQGYVDVDPCRRIRDTRTAYIMQPVLTAEQRELIRTACRTERELALVDLLYSSGMRVSEVIRLDRADIDLRRRRAKCYGKGRKEREVMFSAECGVHLARYLEERTDTDPALFVRSRRPYERLSRDAVEGILRTIRKREPGLAHVRLTPHTFRRTRVTDLINRGMPAELVAKKFGHEKVQTTLDCYAAISRETVWAAEEKYG